MSVERLQEIGEEINRLHKQLDSESLDDPARNDIQSRMDRLEAERERLIEGE